MKLLLVSDILSGTNTLNLAKLADFFGLERVSRPPHSSDYVIVVSQESAGAISDLPPAKAVLVYNCSRDSEKFKVVDAGGGLYRVSKIEAVTRQLSGLAVVNGRPHGSRVLQGVENSEILISLGDDPFFVRQRDNGCEWFFSTSHRVVDLDDRVTQSEFKVDDIFAEIIPFAMFFQYVSGTSRCSHYANLIIDDPSLMNRYGNIEYKEALDFARKKDFALTIAFIPWNYRKSDCETVKLFAANQDKLSICVHGCDHTAGEFASVDERTLSWKASLAIRRMEQHKKRFGLPYDNVIVFPQGAFSEESMHVLQEHGFAAAVNSTLIACNNSGGIRISEMITPETTRYGLPLLHRRYPEQINDFAYDLFFGRPVLIVQHNIDFVEGWDRIINFIDQLKVVEPGLKWIPLGKLVEKYVGPAKKPEWNGAGVDVQCGYTLQSYVRTALRRYLCDIRDTCLCKSKFLGGIVTRR